MSGSFQGYEDFLRHKADRAINTAKVKKTVFVLVLRIFAQVKVLKEGKVVSVQSQDIKVAKRFVDLSFL